MHRMVKIDNETLRKAEENWYKVHFGIRCEETMERYFNYCHSHEQSFIDDELTPEDDSLFYYVAPETANRIKLLASPNAETVVRAYYAKYGYGGRTGDGNV